MSQIFSRDPSMNQLITLLQNVAVSKATILLTGESGVGKEQMAKYIHSVSPRSKQPMVAINCAALPYNLLESELFGFEKGAFTGAHQAKPGKIELADGGTFLLDEISELPLDLQGKLLRAIQEKEVERLGSKSPKKVDVRFICTTNKDLREMVQLGQFRKDLFYRINVVPVYIPSLKNRPQDISYYAEMFTQKVCEENGILAKSLSLGALQKIKEWNWPGNVRELRNVIERSVLMTSEQEIQREHILIEGMPGDSDQSFGPGMTVQQAERLLIEKTLQYTNENRTQAARMLGISIRTLRNKLNEYSKEGGHCESGL